MAVLISLLLTLRDGLRSRATLQLEVLALPHQLHVLERSRTRRLRLTRADRLLWVWFARAWHNWRYALVIVKRETVVGWHRRGLRLFWTWKSRHRLGRPWALYKFLNTSLGLWLLSATVLSAGSYEYIQWRAKATEAQQRQEQRTKLDTELKVRLQLGLR
jgi:hypothetical protein